jgi:hypothetical protein
MPNRYDGKLQHLADSPRMLVPRLCRQVPQRLLQLLKLTQAGHLVRVTSRVRITIRDSQVGGERKFISEKDAAPLFGKVRLLAGFRRVA